MSLLKNILMISYLKNKGVRRICFLLGIIFGGICFSLWYQNFKRTNYKLSYQTLEQAVMDNEYNTVVLEHIYKNYPAGFNFGESFYDWKRFFTGYEKSYEEIRSLCDKKAGEVERNDICSDLKSYVYQPVQIESVDSNKWYGIKWVIFWFYFPFLFCLPFRWIYQGFKESKKKLDK